MESPEALLDERPPSPLFEWALVVMPFVVAGPTIVGGVLTPAIVAWSVGAGAGVIGLYALGAGPGSRDVPRIAAEAAAMAAVWWIAGVVTLVWERPLLTAAVVATGPMPLAACVHAGTVLPLGRPELEGRTGGLLGMLVGIVASALLVVPYTLVCASVGGPS